MVSFLGAGQTWFEFVSLISNQANDVNQLRDTKLNLHVMKSQVNRQYKSESRKLQQHHHFFHSDGLANII